MSKVTNGIQKIEYAPLANDKGPGTIFEVFGLTSQGTPKITEEDPKVTEFYSEEFDDPVDISVQKGKKEFDFSLMCANAAAMMKVLGGTVDAGPPAVWSAPDNLPIIEGTFKITPRQGQIIIINRGNMRAKLNHDLSKTGQLLIDIKIQVLQPEKTGVKAISYTDAA